MISNEIILNHYAAETLSAKLVTATIAEDAVAFLSTMGESFCVSVRSLRFFVTKGVEWECEGDVFVDHTNPPPPKKQQQEENEWKKKRKK